MNESIYHIPVMLNESIEGLNLKPDGIYVDATFGGGGHSREIIKHLTNGKLFAFDQDEDAMKNAFDDKRFAFILSNFKYIKNFLKYYKIDKVDGILADLGVSSHHFDDTSRGFSFRSDGKLDMRMNQNSSFSAETIVNNYTIEQLSTIFRNYGEISNTSKLVYSIENFRKQQQIQTINQFLDAIKNSVPKNGENKFLAQVFQALRMEVNNELQVLKDFLEQTASILKKDGRLVVITYHSLEDRLVKNMIKSGNTEGNLNKDFYGNINTPLIAVNKKIIVPSEEEIKMNNRARSAKLRIAEKI